jgi:glutaredoxin
MKRAFLIAILLTASATLAAAQLYRWVDEKGNVEWRDTPPPPAAKKVEQRKVGGSTIETSELPFSLQQAVKRFPVTLWTTDCGEACTKARAHLARRGVPHTEKNPQVEIENFKKASGGSMEVPMLLVGANRLTGYHEINWDAALDSAGYPKTAMVKLKPQPRQEAAPAAKPPVTDKPQVKLYTTADCGQQCNDARQALIGRGVQFQEVSVEGPAAIEELRKISGNTLVPTLHVGRFVIPGFDRVAYNRVLDESGIQPAQ